MCKTGTPYKVMLAKEAEKEWDNLNNSIKILFKKKLKKIMYNPIIPANQLSGGLSTCYKIKLRRAGYRLVYEVHDKTVILIIWAIDKRDKYKVYQKAVHRLQSCSSTNLIKIEV